MGTTWQGGQVQSGRGGGGPPLRAGKGGSGMVLVDVVHQGLSSNCWLLPCSLLLQLLWHCGRQAPLDPRVDLVSLPLAKNVV